MQAFKKTEAKHVIVIAVDGPSVSGKGTLAKALAARLGYAYLDTGALYRTIALAVLKRGGDPANFEDVKPVLASIQRVFTVSEMNDPALRGAEVASSAAKVAAMPEVRAAVHIYQRAFIAHPPGHVGGVVVDGRAIGTVVCPDAEVKLFVTATPEERAWRRYEELKKRDPAVTPEMVLRDINDRDQRDVNRAISPLRAADDAYVLDNTKLTPDEALEEAMRVVRSKGISNDNGKLPAAGKNAKPTLP